MSMNYMVAIGMVICLLSISAAAFSETEVSSSNFLSSFDTEFSAFRSISNSEITLPDLKLISDSRITTEAYTKSGGTSEILQNAFFRGLKSNDGSYSFFGSLSSSASATGVRGLESVLNFKGSSIVLNPADDPDSACKVEAKLLGLSMASPGSNNYIFASKAEHNTETDTAILSAEEWMTEEPKIFELSIMPDSLEFDEPVDSIEEDLTLSFGLSHNDLAYYAYDFSRTIENDDVTFISEMTYKILEG